MNDEQFNIFLDKLEDRRGPINVTGYKFTPEQYLEIIGTVKILNIELEQWSVNLKNRVVNHI